MTTGSFGPVSDKVDGGYLSSYLRIAAELGPAARVCELGVDKGDSLRLWQALFPLGQVTGVDVNPEAIWPPGTGCVIAAQDDPALPSYVCGPFDLIVDDASHDGQLSLTSYIMLWTLLAPGGYYVIEDWFIGLGEFRDHPMYNSSMLSLVTTLLLRLSSKESEVDEITYRYGLAIVHKRKP